MADDAVRHILWNIPHAAISRNSGKRNKNSKLNPRNATGDMLQKVSLIIVISYALKKG